MLVAVTVGVPAVDGAVYRPAEVIDPAVADHVTAGLDAPVAIPVNCCVPPGGKLMMVGLIATDDAVGVGVGEGAGVGDGDVDPDEDEVACPPPPPQPVMTKPGNSHSKRIQADSQAWFLIRNCDFILISCPSP